MKSRTVKIAVLTGAGTSAESGISTFRDAGGLWDGHRIEDVATPVAWRRNPQMVLDFYNERRRLLLQAEPNAAHTAIAALEKDYQVTVITQNVDDLHERAGSSLVIHLHGELLKVRSDAHESLIYDWRDDLHIGDTCERGAQLRPHIVWFGEMVPMLEPAIDEISDAGIVMVIGSSMKVYPAAGLAGYALPGARLFYIDPRPQLNFELQNRPRLKIIAEKATVGVPIAISML